MPSFLDCKRLREHTYLLSENVFLSKKEDSVLDVICSILTVLAGNIIFEFLAMCVRHESYHLKRALLIFNVIIITITIIIIYNISES